MNLKNGNRAGDPQRTRVKVCGLTRRDDVRAAVDAGVDAIGLVFYPPSRRYLNAGAAATLRDLVPAFVDTVALFVNPSVADVREVIEAVGPDLLQFHGEESPQFCTQFGVRYLKGFRVGAPGQDTADALAAHCAAHGRAAAWLFDSFSQGYGGSGTSLDPALLREVARAPDARPLVLAGGLSAGNVGARVAELRPYAVDVSSGVEESPGLKDPARIVEFMRAVRAADAQAAIDT
ncbi:phosphoribosylanthranilate isomerase [Castellaniella sp. GW247-6E4]|uniref:phosphoribosylanthranilate isomerase n=1 Tax=Castellaniella sp. GW247-6E4 TaxID=3140380 RepID=UPI0033154065